MADLDLVDPAPAGRRLIGAVIDAVPAVALAVAAVVLGDPVVRWILIGCLLAYLVLLWAWAAYDGRGPGKWSTGLRVINARTGRRPGAWPALVRLAARGVIAVGTLGIAGLSYRWDPEGLEQTWWDRVAGSRVVAVGTAVGDGRIATGGRRLGGSRDDPAGGVRGVGADDPVARARWTPEPAGRPNSSGPTVGPPGVVAGPRPPDVAGPAPLGPSVAPGPVSEPSRPEPARAGRYTPVTLAPTAPPAGLAGPAGPGVVESPTVRVPPPGRTGRSAGTSAGPGQAAGSPDLPMIRNVPLPAAGGGVVGEPAGGGVVGEPGVGGPGERTVSMRARTVTLAWDSGRTVVVTGRVLVGREPEPEPGEIVERTLAVETDSRGVSKTHLSIDVGPAGVTVTDRHSTNGVRLVRADGIGARVPAGEPVDVWVGDRLEFGGRSLRIAEIGS